MNQDARKNLFSFTESFNYWVYEELGSKLHASFSGELVEGIGNNYWDHLDAELFEFFDSELMRLVSVEMANTVVVQVRVDLF